MIKRFHISENALIKPWKSLSAIRNPVVKNDLSVWKYSEGAASPA